jgi:hypothetical protein
MDGVTDEWVRKIVQEHEAILRGKWDANGRRVPGIVEIIQAGQDAAKEAAEQAKANAIAATAAAKTAQERADGNRRWLIGTFGLGALGLLIKGLELYALAHGTH